MVVQGEEVAVVQGQSNEGSVESWLGLGGLGVPGLPSLSVVAKYSCLLCWTPREKSSVEEEIKEKEEAIRQRSSEVQVRSHCLCLSVSLCLWIYEQTESMAWSCRYLLSYFCNQRLSQDWCWNIIRVHV